VDRILLIRKSLNAFMCSLFGLLPIIGLVPAVCALGYWVRVRSGCRNEWNPASFYLELSVLLGVVGILVSLLAAAIIGLAIASSY
jgi:hypothetical protein